MQIKCESCNHEGMPKLIPHLRDMEVAGRSLIIGDGTVEVLCQACGKLYTITTYKFHHAVDHVCEDVQVNVWDHEEWMESCLGGARITLRFKTGCLGCDRDFPTEFNFNITAEELL